MEGQQEQTQSKWYELILDWLKANVGIKTLQFVSDNGGTFIIKNIKGFWGKIAGLVWKWLIIPLVKRLINHIENKKEAKEELEKLKEVLNKEEVTNEEIIKAEDDFFNRP